MKKLASIIWRIMPESLHRAMAIEAPVVLQKHTWRGVTCWMRHELDYGPIAEWPNEDSLNPNGWVIPGGHTIGIPGMFKTSQAASDCLTETLRKRRDFVLVEGER